MQQSQFVALSCIEANDFAVPAAPVVFRRRTVRLTNGDDVKSVGRKARAPMEHGGSPKPH
jgi:hypothetical protein